MQTILWIILVTAVAGVLGTGIGGTVGIFLKNEPSKTASLMLAFAGGIMLSVVCFDLFPEALDPEGSEGGMPLALAAGGAAAGYAIVYLLNLWIDASTNPEVKHIDKLHPKTADDLNELIHYDHYEVHSRENASRSELMIAGIVMAAAIALHNLPEGMVIGASYAGDSGSVTGGAGFISAIVIGLHNIPEGMSVSVPLVLGGEKPSKAVLFAALSGLPTVAGAVIGYTLGMISPVWLTVSLSFAGGAMLYVVFGELLPEAFLMWRSKAPSTSAFIGIIVGAMLVYGLI